MFLLFRWHVHPTAANFKRMPEWLCPRISQILKEHPIWVDYLPWPRLRDLIIQSSTPTPCKSFFVPFSASVSVNWPPERDCLMEVQNPADPGGEKIWVLNPEFESHWRNLENWCLGKEFADEFPDFVEGVKIV